MAKAVWGFVALFIGADSIPSSVNQYYNWINSFLPQGKVFHVLGFAVVCWVIWKARNKACFEKKDHSGSY